MDFSTCNFTHSFFNLGNRFYTPVKATGLQSPYWIHANDRALALLMPTVNTHDFKTPENLQVFSGLTALANNPSLAMVYAGHQFGGYSAQLGDGRGLLIGQVNTQQGIIDIHLKGAGKTPYSRFGDGRAVLRSSLREYLASEAMHGLGIPTTRALCIVGSDEPVIREDIETAAITTRLAKTHIRFGHFEYFHYAKQYDAVKQLADHIIEQFIVAPVPGKQRYAQLLDLAVKSTASMIASWQAVGFAHGVMNTDNMSIIGETFDYGPYGFLDDYEPGFICNHSDHTGRYAFDEQPGIGLWNLNALAHSLSSLIDTDTIKVTLGQYEVLLVQHYVELMRKKLGLKTTGQEDQALSARLLQQMALEKIDYTHCFRTLCDFKMVTTNNQQPMADNNHTFIDLFTDKEKIWDWGLDYSARLQREGSIDSDRQQFMRRHNPKYVLRNYLIQRAIAAAQQKDYREIDRLLTLAQYPYDEHPGMESYAASPSTADKHLSISCSS
jgi:serine/tyrosine/threonine adenylyltransferase